MREDQTEQLHGCEGLGTAPHSDGDSIETAGQEGGRESKTELQEGGCLDG